MKWRAVAWDVDGTLVDSEPRHHRALLAASGRWNVDLSDLPNEAFRGVHMVDVWAELAGRYPPGLVLEEWLHAINAEYVRDAQPMPTFPGAVEVIRTLAMHGIPQVCVSNSSRVVVTANISSLDIGGFLKGVVTFDDVTAGKPDPEPYHKACKCLGIDAPEVLAVEDSLTGIRSAAAAGLSVIGFHPAGALLEGANETIQNLLEVLKQFPNGDF